MRERERERERDEYSGRERYDDERFLLFIESSISVKTLMIFIYNLIVFILTYLSAK